jgi:hypothetical protein
MVEPQLVAPSSPVEDFLNREWSSLGTPLKLATPRRAPLLPVARVGWGQQAAPMATPTASPVTMETPVPHSV